MGSPIELFKTLTVIGVKVTITVDGPVCDELVSSPMEDDFQMLIMLTAIFCDRPFDEMA